MSTRKYDSENSKLKKKELSILLNHTKKLSKLANESNRDWILT